MAIKNYTSSVDVFKSLGEIQGALAKQGASRVVVDYDDGHPVSISFALTGCFGTQGFVLPAFVDGTMRAFQKAKIKADREQAERTAWRNIRDWVLAQIALIESCDIPIEQIFLPYMVSRSGQTLYESYLNGQLLIGDGNAENNN